MRNQHASALLARVMAALQATLAANGMLRCAWMMLVRVLEQCFRVHHGRTANHGGR